jgi:predicted nucleic acid-binding protein
LTPRLYTLLTPLLAVTDEVFRVALGLEVQDLGANDRLHAGTCLVHGIDTIVSANRAFDALQPIRRVDPLDERAVTQLLKGAN